MGIPAKKSVEGEVYSEEFKLLHFGYVTSEFGIEWMRYEEECPLPETVKTIPHFTFRGSRLQILNKKYGPGIEVIHHYASLGNEKGTKRDPSSLLIRSTSNFGPVPK